MAFQKPIRELPFRRWTKEESLADSKRIDAIARLLPEAVVREAVKRFFASPATKAAIQSLGDPRRFMKFLGVGLLNRIWYTIISFFRPEPENDRKVVAAEAKTLSQEYAKYWCNRMLHASQVWSASSVITLNPKRFLPDKPAVDDPAWEEWDEWRQKALASLFNSVALTVEDMQRLTDVFCQEALKELHRSGRIELPERLEVALMDEIPVLRRRTR